MSANIAEAWEHTRYKPMFVSKLTRAAGEAAETQNWIDYAVGSDYLSAEEGAALHDGYDSIIRTLRSMIIHSEKWCPKTYRAEVHES